MFYNFTERKEYKVRPKQYNLFKNRM